MLILIINVLIDLSFYQIILNIAKKYEYQISL
jgi:hypothetical protein